MLIGAENRSIKQVLTLVFLIAVLLLALLLAMTAARQIVDHLKNDAISDTYQIAERLAKDSRLAIIQMAPENVMSSVRMALDFPNIEGIVLFEKQGILLLGTPPKEVSFDEIAKSDFSTDKARLLKETPSTIFIVSPVIIATTDQSVSNEDITDATGNVRKTSHRDLIGYVLLSLSKAELYKTREQVWRESLLVIIIITSVFLIVLMQVLNRITTPIRDLARFMTHPDTAKYYRNAPVEGVKEAREISSSFNALMGALERSNTELQLSNEKLEARVLERTQDLKQARDEAQKYNKENRTLISSMNTAVEEERKFIARELHDHLNAELLFIKLKLRRFKTASASQDVDTTELGNSVDELIERISDVYDSSRNIVTMLRPEVMDSLGLIGAIEERIDMFTRSQPGCKISFDHEGNYSELSYPISIAIFRIVQESLTNASKHAQATDIKIHLCLNCENYPSGIYLCVSDNGKGFDTQVCSHSGIGLISMRERTFALNGQLKVESTTGLGTRIIACIPLDILTINPATNRADLT
jgi:signal transduction histidine kinase